MDTHSAIESAELPTHETERLIMAVTGLSRPEVVGGAPLEQSASMEIAGLVVRRIAGEPLQYLEGTAQFGPIEVMVDPRVLIPRPETEQLWERLMSILPDRAVTVIDLCTGSGCIALATKHQRHDLWVHGTDVSTDAVDVARHNAGALGLDVRFHAGDLFDALDPALKGEVGAVVANPPYVARLEWEALPPDVRDHEPSLALIADEDGLMFFRRISEEAGEWLVEDGVVIVEIGELQGDQVIALFEACGWNANIDIDLTGRDRFVTARRNQ